MKNLLSLWANLGNGRRAILVGATVAMFLAILGLARFAGQTDMALLYSGLDSASSGAVLTALDQQAVAYEIRGDAIYVDQAKRDGLRMTLASQGLPTTGGSGYELLDSLSGFGTTSQMFDAAYWRAKEGELARTVLALPEVKSVRVHVAEAPKQLFQDKTNPTASVIVTTRSGALTADQARAIRHLVAGAVSGMQAEDVAVIDSIAGLVASEADDSAPNTAGVAKAVELKQNVERLLAARVGAGKAVVEVTVDVVTDREEVNQRTLDPQGKVAISTDTQDKSGTSSGNDGSVTVASNLPSGAAGASGGNQSQNSDKSERVNYEVSETNRQVIKLPGAVAKLSVAVLVDQETVTAADGSVTFQPRSEAELATLKELVASAVGLDTTRGDVLTLKSLPFKQPSSEGTLAESGSSLSGALDIMTVIQLAVLSLVALILGLFVIRPILMSQRGQNQLALPSAPLSLAGASADAALTGEIDDSGIFSQVADFSEPEAAMTGVENDPVARLRRLIDERQSESIEILRSWMENDGEAA